VRAGSPKHSDMKGRAGRISMAVGSADRAAAAEGKLFEIALRQKHDEISRRCLARTRDAFSDVARRRHRGEGAGHDARLYSEAGRYGESFSADRTATGCSPMRKYPGKARTSGSAVCATLSGIEGNDLPRSMRSGCSTNIAN